MGFRAIGLLACFWAGVSWAACSTPPSTSSTTGTSSTGEPPNCDGLFFDYVDDGGPCNQCMFDNCCAELAACGTEHCIFCASGGGDPCCATPCADVDPAWRVVRRCAGEKCKPSCFPTCAPGFCPDGGDGG